MPTAQASGYRAIFFAFYSPHLSAYFKDSITSVSGKELKIEKRPKNWEERTEGTTQKEEMVERMEEGVPREEAPACCREIPELLRSPPPRYLP